MRLLCLAWLLSACVTTPVRGSAFRIERQNDLIGGPQALGQVGDYKLQNGKIAVIVQDVGLSRGFGVYGGSLIDADLRRPGDYGGADGGHGNDRFAEMFSVFFLQAMRPTKIEITNDGSDGKPARLLISGDGGPFLTQVNLLNDFVLGPGFKYSIEYSIGADDQFIRVTSSIKNETGVPRQMLAHFGGFTLPVPFGTVALFGATNKVFIPGRAGYDLRYTLPEITAAEPKLLPALPGIVTDLIATSGEGVSYGVFAEDNPASNFAWSNRDQYKDATGGSLEIPFFFSSFIGYYYGIAPEVLQDKDIFTFTQYFAVGRGDVASVRDVYHAVRGVQTGTFGGRVRDAQTLRGIGGISVVVYDGSGGLFNQHTTDANGDFSGTLPAGDYAYEVVSDARLSDGKQPFSVQVGKTTSVEPLVSAAGLLNVSVTDERGTRLPAKVIVTGVHDLVADNEPRRFLFDLRKGERRRQVDQITDTADPDTRRYVEAQFWTYDGQLGEQVRPGHYTVIVQRGPEYDVASTEVDIRAGEETRFATKLVRVVDSKGYVSGDLHLHSANSIDAKESVATRVIGCAAEGLDFAVATDHNFITDYSPYIARYNLQQFLSPIVGLEMTTLELGHFNAYPLKYDVQYANRGPIKWYDRNAKQVFDDLRNMGKYGPADTIVQVNHPRDTILGYFNDISLDADTMETILPRTGLLQPQGAPFAKENASFDFDAIEIFNGKRWDLLRTIRAPDPLPPPPYVVPAVHSGDILRYPTGRIAYPGAVDDWFKLLNRGYRFTGTANSDSHSNSVEEPGTPRTYVGIGVDDPFEIRDLDVARAIKAHKAVLTNGPFVELFVNDVPVGGELQGAHEATVRVRVQKAAYVHVERLNLYVNGEVARSFALRDVNDETVTDTVSFARDSYVVAEVTGERVSLWPMVTGWEELPLTLQDALRDLAGPLGINFDSLGSLQPRLDRPVFPYAVTNPVWVDYEGDQVWSPPGVVVEAPAARQGAGRQPPPPGDIRALFQLFGGHH